MRLANAAGRPAPASQPPHGRLQPVSRRGGMRMLPTQHQSRSQQHSRTPVAAAAPSNDASSAAAVDSSPPADGPPPADEPQQQVPPQEQQQQSQSKPRGVTLPAGREVEGVILLLLVAFLWGSYGPALRLAYGLPGPPTPLAVTAVSGCIEMVVLLGVALARAAAGGAEKSAASKADSAQRLAESPAPQLLWQWLALPATVLAGLELGLENTAASYAQIAGLELTSATRAAFLIQASIVFTPALSTLAGMAPSRPVWIGSLLALLGTVVITRDVTSSPLADGVAAAGISGTGLAAGDALTLLSALCYSVATVRLPVWAVRYRVPALQLALGKAVVLTLVAAGAAGVQLAASGQPAASLWPGWQSLQGWGIMLWAALGPGALASVLHVKGQSLVPPASAQILFCSVPVWSAALAALVLPGGERVGLCTWAGGALVAAAGLVAALGKGRRQAAVAVKRE